MVLSGRWAARLASVSIGYPTQRGNPNPSKELFMNLALAVLLADGIYIGGGVILLIVIVLLVLWFMRRA